MTQLAQYVAGALLPDLHVWWREADGATLVDLTSGHDFTVKVGQPGAAATIDKSTGISGAAGSGDGLAAADAPNLVVAWAAGELDVLPVGVHTVQITATRTSDSKPRRLQVQLEIVAAIS